MNSNNQGEDVTNNANRPNTSESIGSSNTNYANAFNIGYQNHFYQQQQSPPPPPPQVFQPPMPLQYQPQTQPPMYPPMQSQYQPPVNYGPPLGAFSPSNNTEYPQQPPYFQTAFPPPPPPNNIPEYHDPTNMGGYHQNYNQQYLPINQTQFPNPTGLVQNVPPPTGPTQSGTSNTFKMGSNNAYNSINEPENESSDVEELSKDEYNLQTNFQKEWKPKDHFYTIDELKSKLEDPFTAVEIKFEYYTQLSDHFIKKAHMYVAKTKDSEVMGIYYKLIKIAISCLEILDTKYKLNDYQRFIVYFKLAIIYFQETGTLLIGETYLRKATKLLRELGEVIDHLKCQLLLCQYLDKTKLKSLINYLNAEIQKYNDIFSTLIVECFELFKIKYYLVHNPDVALTLLTKISQQKNNDASGVKTYCLILSSNLQLYRGSPHVALDLIAKAERFIQKYKFDSLVLPGLLVKLAAFIQLNKDCKSLIRQISENFNKYGKLHNDGQIELRVFISELSYTFNLKFDWLTTEEISIIIHFLTGVSFLKDSKNKSQICFNKALKNLHKIQKYDKYHDLSIVDFNRRQQRLKYLKIYFNIYKTINNFILNDYKIDPLNEFMQQTNQIEFDKEFSIIIQSVYPLIYYCFAMFYHHNADLQAAKYYYLKVIQLLGNNVVTTTTPEITENSFLQLFFGVPCQSVAPKGKFNELYVFATLNLTILLDYEHGILKDKTPSYSIQLKHKCLNDLEQAFKNSQSSNNTTNAFNQNFTLNSDIMHITYNLLLKVLFQKPIDLEFDTKLREMLEILGPNSAFAFFYILIMYLLDFRSLNNNSIDEQKHLLQNYQDKLKFDNDTEWICKLLALKSFMKYFKLMGDHDKSYLSQMQYEQCEKMLMTKFQFLKNNVVGKDENFKDSI